MKVLTKGHRYVLPNFEDITQEGQVLQFIHKEPSEEAEGGSVTVADGTTNESVLEVLIDRMNFLQSKFPCDENVNALVGLNTALEQLNLRTQKRKERGVEGKHVE